MRVYKCDRCGKYVSRTVRDFFVRNPTRGIYELRKNIHLCNDYAKSFREWFGECEKELGRVRDEMYATIDFGERANGR